MPKDTHSTLPAGADLVLPEQATVAFAELTGAARDGLLALAVGTGLQVLSRLLDAEVDRLVGPRGRHNPQRVAVRHGTQPGRVTLGGRRVRVDRPRVRRADGAGELPLPTWEGFSSTELLDQLALERMLAGCGPCSSRQMGRPARTLLDGVTAGGMTSGMTACRERPVEIVTAVYLPAPSRGWRS
jgi:hypothetical protein